MADFILSPIRLPENERRGGSRTDFPTTLNLRGFDELPGFSREELNESQK